MNEVKANRLDEIIASRSRREGPLLPILHDVQAEFGCIDDDTKRTIAKALNLSRAEVQGVVSFYHDFKAETGTPSGAEALPRRGLQGARRRGACCRRGSRSKRPRRDRDHLLPGPVQRRPQCDDRQAGACAPRPGQARRVDRGDGVMVAVRISDDALAIACGADAVAAAFEKAGHDRRARVELGHAVASSRWSRSTARALAPPRPRTSPAIVDGSLRRSAIGSIAEHPFDRRPAAPDLRARRQDASDQPRGL